MSNEHNDQSQDQQYDQPPDFQDDDMNKQIDDNKPNNQNNSSQPNDEKLYQIQETLDQNQQNGEIQNNTGYITQNQSQQNELPKKQLNILKNSPNLIMRTINQNFKYQPIILKKNYKTKDFIQLFKDQANNKELYFYFKYKLFFHLAYNPDLGNLSFYQVIIDAYAEGCKDPDNFTKKLKVIRKQIQNKSNCELNTIPNEDQNISKQNQNTNQDWTDQIQKKPKTNDGSSQYENMYQNEMVVQNVNESSDHGSEVDYSHEDNLKFDQQKNKSNYQEVVDEKVQITNQKTQSRK